MSSVAANDAAINPEKEYNFFNFADCFNIAFPLIAYWFYRYKRLRLSIDRFFCNFVFN